MEAGNWELVFNTEPLEVDFHTAKALFQIAAGGNIIKSGFSKSVSFHVGKLVNGDRFNWRANPMITDFGNVFFSVIGNDFRNGESTHPCLTGSHSASCLGFKLVGTQCSQLKCFTNLTCGHLFTSANDGSIIRWNQKSRIRSK